MLKRARMFPYCSLSRTRTEDIVRETVSLCLSGTRFLHSLTTTPDAFEDYLPRKYIS